MLNSKKLAVLVLALMTSRVFCVDKPPCVAWVVRGVLNLEPCNDRATITSIQGTHTIDCNDLPAAVLFGPLYITTGGQSCVAEGLPICPSLPDQAPLSVNCRSGLHTATWAFIAVTVMAIVGPFLWWRYTRIIDTIGPANGQGVVVERRHLSVIVTWEQEDPEDLIYEDGAVRPRVVTVSRRVGWVKLALMVIAFWTDPVISTRFTIEMSRGSTVWVSDTKITSQDYFWEYSTVSVYDTMPYQVSMEYDTHCTQSACDSHGACGTTTAMGKQSGKMLWESERDKRRHIYTRWCAYSGNACFLWQGCWKWLLDVSVDPRDLSTVNRLSPGILRYNVTSSGGNCTVSSVKSRQVRDMGQFSVLDTGNVSYLCPYPDSYGNPQAGFLGDFQVSGGWRVKMDQKAFQCSKYEGRGAPVCTYPEPAIDSVISNSDKLPVNSDEWSVERVENAIRIRDSTPLEIDLQCTVEPQVSPHGCNGLTLIIIGEALSPRGRYLVVKPKDQSSDGFWIGKVPCWGEQLMIPCKSSPLMFPITNSEQCKEEVEGIVDTSHESRFVLGGGFETTHPLQPHPDSLSVVDSTLTFFKSWVARGGLMAYGIGLLILLRTLR